MSLFGKTDAEQLPLLTQYVQLEQPPLMELLNTSIPRDEVARLLTTEIAQWYLQREKVSTDSLVDPVHQLAMATYTNAGEHDQLLSRLQHLAGFHFLVVSLLNDIADTGAVCPSKAQSVQPLLDMYLRPALMVAMDGENSGGELEARTIALREVKDNQPIPIARLSLSVPPGDTLTELLRQVQAVLLGRERLARCPECDHVFMVTRKGREFCSIRCVNRVMARRSRARRLAAQENVMDNGGKSPVFA